MTTKFGWCMGPEGAHIQHDACPHQIGTSNGITTCSCPCHKEGE
jgi:hypothetical protein